MTPHAALWLTRAFHSIIYVAMSIAAVLLLFAGVTGLHGWWLWAAGGLMTVEVIVFAASGMRCPLTAIALRNGAAQEGGSDTFFPERMTRHTLQVFGPVLLIAALVLVGRACWFGWR